MNKGWKFPFGKHKGETLQEVSTNDLEYVNWCIDNIEWFGKLLMRSKEDPWIKKLIWCIKTERRNLKDREDVWCWFGGRFPRFGDRTSRILFDPGPEDSDSEDGEIEEPDYGVREGDMVSDD